MKILAIRGRNLTSLAGDFTVEFDRGPLQNAGLFALTGPTGAGKTTLLDALCLALFDRTPRLQGKSAVKVAGSDGEGISAIDPRNLLRRGAGEGFAEVEFTGRDAQRYRARWSVARAYNDPAGKLQPAELELHQIDGPLIAGGKKGEVLAAIEQRLGLTFEQFTRSALLAQGDFAAFLRASAKERADLLERMTGTVLFREISLAAYRRMAAAVQKRDELARDRDSTPRLEPEARLQIEKQRLEAADTLILGHAALEKAQQAVAWHAEAAKKSQEVTFAGSAHASAGLERAKLADLHLQTTQVGRVQPLKGPFWACRQAKTALQDAEEGLKRHVDLHVEALATQNRAREACAQAETALLGAQEALRAVLPQLKAARALDVQHAAALQGELQAAREQAERRNEHREALDRGGRAAEAVQTQLDALERLRSQRPDAAIEPLAADWPRWEAALGRHLALLQEAEQLNAHQAQAARRVQAGVLAHAAAAERLAQAADELNQAEAAVQQARSEVEAIPQAALQAARTHLQQRIERHGQLAPVVQQARALHGEQVQLQASSAEVKAGIAQAQVDAHVAEQAQSTLQIRLEEATAALRTVQARLDLSGHRAALRDGEPCPLCGACAHPFARTELGDGLLSDAQARVDGLVASLEQARGAFLQASTRRAAAEQRLREQQARRVVLDGQLAQLHARHAALGEPTSPADDRAQVALEALAQQIEAEKRALTGQERASAQAQAALEQARVQFERLQARREALRGEEAHAQAEIERARTAEETARRDLARIEHELQAGRPALTEVLGDAQWEADLLRQAQTFLAARARAVKGFLAWTAAFTTENERLTAARQAHDAALLATEALRPPLERAEAAHQAQVRAKGAIAEQRAQLLGGKPADVVEGELAGALAQAEAHCRSRRQALEQLTAQAATRAQQRQAAQTLLGERESLHAQHVAALEQGQMAMGLTAGALKSLLAHTPEWLSQAQATCEAADAAVARAETVLTERQAQLAAHLAARPADLGAAEAAAQVEQRTREVETLTATRATLQHQLALDDAAAARFQERSLAHQHAEAEAAVWERLSALIGSADGAKFQKFAQGLTLDLLLEQANAHLGDLAPRYLLQRIPGTELELQVVDREMGDEVRATASLSGGESFLASLALALGLSALAGRQTAIDSLFIDEGFGTLDPATLDIALGALDALQAQGRQIGLISHVAGLAERVGAQVQVVKRGADRSEVRVVGWETAPAPVNLLVPGKRRRRARPIAAVEE